MIRTKKKRSREFSDVIVVILLVAVILASFIGSFLIYASLDVKNNSSNGMKQGGPSFDSGSGMVTVQIVDDLNKEGDMA